DFRSLGPDDDVYTVTLDRALELLAEPKRARKAAEPLRELGPHPVDGEPIVVLSGRYGPYVKHGSVNATLPKDVAPETLTVEAALELLARKAESGGKKARGRRGAAKGTTAKGAAK